MVLSILRVKQFSTFPTLSSRVQTELETFVDTCQLTMVQRAQEILSQAEQEPFTMNKYYEHTGTQRKPERERITQTHTTRVHVLHMHAHDITCMAIST